MSAPSPATAPPAAAPWQVVEALTAGVKVWSVDVAASPFARARMRDALEQALAETGHRIVPDFPGARELEPADREGLPGQPELPGLFPDAPEWFRDRITRDPVFLNAPVTRAWALKLADYPDVHPVLVERYGTPDNPRMFP